MDEVFIEYKKEVERCQRVILSMPIINDDMRQMHEFMTDMYGHWVDKLNAIEEETLNPPVKKKRKYTRRKKK